jgi:hypothetical protein
MKPSELKRLAALAVFIALSACKQAPIPSEPTLPVPNLVVAPLVAKTPFKSDACAPL